MLIPMSPDLYFAFLRQERIRGAKARRLADLAQQYAKAQRACVKDDRRKDLE
jgi:hypothetical protein